MIPDDAEEGNSPADAIAKTRCPVLSGFSRRSRRLKACRMHSRLSRPVHLPTLRVGEIPDMSGASRSHACFNRSIGLLARFDAVEEIGHVIDRAVAVAASRHHRILFARCSFAMNR